MSKGKPRAPYVDEATERRRVRQRAYYYANRDKQLAVARQRYLDNKPQLNPAEQAERDAIAATRSQEAKRRKAEANAARKADQAKRQRRWLNRLKVRRGCVDCGYNDWPSALHFDHRPGETKCFEIGKRVSGSWSALLDEVAKCDVRCANCHAKVTDLRRYGVPHGG